MKKFTLFMALVLFASFGFAQAVIFQDDFESYTVGAKVAQNSSVWTTWSNAPGGAEDAVISDDTASSPTKSMMVSGTNDMILPFGNKTSGKYMISFDFFVPTGFAGYYNIQHFEAPGNEWACEVYFTNNGTGYIEVNNIQTNFTFPMNTWFEVENYVNIDEDSASLTVNGVLVHSWQFSMQASSGIGTNQLGGMNMYAGAPTGQTPKYYVDNVVYAPVPDLLFADDFEAYTVGNKVAQNSTVWTTWSNAPGGAEDAVISDDTASSPTKSMMVSGTNDMILPLGNKTSGEFLIEFDYFVPTGFAGYYNIQHFEAPGNEWACEVYFTNNGTGYNTVNSINNNFTFPMNTWFTVKNYVNLDADSASLTINGVYVHSWQFSMQSNSGTGTNQLGGIDMYAGAPTGQTPKYYVDDVKYWSLSTELLPPTVNVTPTSITTTGVNKTFTIENVGQQDLNFSVNAIYPSAKGKGTKNGTLTHMTSAMASGVGFTGPITVKAAALFKSEKVADYVGMSINAVNIGIWDMPVGDSIRLMIWERGSYTTPGPGNLIYTAPVNLTLTDTGTVTIPLTTPIYLDGKDIWVGYQFSDADANDFVIGVDAGPRTFQSSWLSTGPGWSEMSGTIDANIAISCLLTGAGFNNWMTITPNTGTVTPAGSSTITVSFDTTGLEYDTTYTGKIVVASNDPNNEYVEVSVALTIPDPGIGVSEIGKIGVMTYPNPAQDFMNVITNNIIETIQIYNVAGQKVSDITVNAANTKVDLRQLEKGTYIVNINVAGQVITRKINVN